MDLTPLTIWAKQLKPKQTYRIRYIANENSYWVRLIKAHTAVQTKRVGEEDKTIVTKINNGRAYGFSRISVHLFMDQSHPVKLNFSQLSCRAFNLYNIYNQLLQTSQTKKNIKFICLNNKFHSTSRVDISKDCHKIK